MVYELHLPRILFFLKKKTGKKNLPAKNKSKHIIFLEPKVMLES